LKTAALDALQPKIDAAETVGSVRLLSVRHEFATEWARFVTTAPDADGLFPLTVRLRQACRTGRRGPGVARRGAVRLGRRRPERNGRGSTGDPQGRLRTGDLRHDELTTHLSSAVGPLLMQLDDNSITDLWLALRWGAEQ
jgi:hypothetical protein